jgi:hypothetical protein
MGTKAITQVEADAGEDTFICDFCHKEHIPNAETIASMAEGDAGGGTSYYGTVAEMFEEILNEK